MEENPQGRLLFLLTFRAGLGESRDRLGEAARRFRGHLSSGVCDPFKHTRPSSLYSRARPVCLTVDDSTTTRPPHGQRGPLQWTKPNGTALGTGMTLEKVRHGSLLGPHHTKALLLGDRGH